jgi:hypothetical protein
MRKLRLIKPWRLRTIRQRTVGESYCTTPEMTAPCCGPRGASEEVTNTRAGFIDLRAPIKNVLRVFHPAEKAPDSTVVPVAGYNIN